MAVQLKVSNSLEVLAAGLAADLRTGTSNVFQPQYLVTQTQGMNNWLKMKIANMNGIAANIRFLKPNDMVYEVYFRLDGPKEQVLAADNLQWVLFSTLNSAEFIRRFPEIAAYYPDGDEIKRLALAHKMADLFDQYQIYRPEMVAAWNQSDAQTLASDWQSWLWNKTREQLGGSMPDKTVILAYIKEALKDSECVRKLKERLPRVHLFGLSILTGFHIDLFRELGEHIDIFFYPLNPAPAYYWYEDRSEEQIARWVKKQAHQELGFAPPVQGNTLLTNWGRVIQDTFGLFFSHEDFLNSYTDLAAVEPQPNTLLGKVQYDIFHNAIDGDRQPIVMDDLSDGSLTINSCFTPAREVEVLYNYLVHLVDSATKPFSPRDIVVMVNDIDAYAPYIKAVFSAAPYLFPFHIADESYQSVDGFFSTLQVIMDLREDQFRAENVLQLLELAYVRNRFRISDIALIRRVVSAANIRFGIAGNQYDDTVTVSWLNGLNRIIYGICMRGDDAYELEGYDFYPLDIAEGEQAFQLIRFTHFIQILIDVVQGQSSPRTLVDWSAYLASSVSQLMYEPSGDEDPDYELFLKQLERLNLLSEMVDEPIGFPVFRQNFINLLAGESRAGNFMSGGITFCSLIPMRSIPFRVVALMGLNFDKFPRRELPVSFSVMEQKRRRGDRNVKENDKHLFLETVLSAQEHLYISYLGRNHKDNTALPPSALVDELIDYIADSASNEAVAFRKKLITVHPLHGFSRLYGDPASGLFSYLGDVPAVIVHQRPAVEPTGRIFDFSEIPLENFIAFFKNPFKLYYNKVLAVYYNEEEVLLADTELFELDSLQKWQLKQKMLFIPEDELDAYRLRAVKTGALPLNRMSELVMEQTQTEVLPAKAKVDACIADNVQRSESISVRIGDATIVGNIDRLYGNKMLITSFSKRDAKYHLESYLRHLVVTAAGLPIATHYIPGLQGSETILVPELFTQEGAKEALQPLVELYCAGHVQPLLFSPDLELDGNKLAGFDDAGFAAYLARTIGGEFGGVHDPYIMKEYENGYLSGNGVVDQWRANVALIYGPVPALFN
jgi:exodeoxyribonuclease V gamma subunit